MARYRRVAPAPRPVAAPPKPTVTLDADTVGTLRKADLVSLAERAGVDATGTKADILARLGSGR